MPNPFYNATGYPADAAFGSSADMRGELELIAGAFDKLATPVGNAGKVLTSDGTNYGFVDAALAVADYSELRAYAGAAADLLVTGAGIAGLFARDAADTTSADNGGTTIVAANGVRWKRGFSGLIDIRWFGAVADTAETVIGTDNAAAITAALAAGPVTIPRPQAGFAFGVSQFVLPRNAFVQGPGMYVLAIRGTSTSSTIRAGTTSGELRREIAINDLYVENNRGGRAIDLDWAPDFTITRSYFRSVGNATLGTTAAGGGNFKNCERGSFTGQVRFGGNPALRIVKDCNAVRGENVILSGGSLGLALDLSGCQDVKLPVTIETSLQGIRIGDNTGANATEGGWCSGIDLSNSYFESVGTPIVAGHGFAINGLKLDDCWLNNAALADNDPFPVSAEILRIGRVKSLRLRGGRWIGAGTEAALKLLDFVVTSGAAPGAIETSDVDLSVFEAVGSLLSNGITSLANTATAAATNRIRTDDFGQGWGVPYEWISPPLVANTTYAQTIISGDFASGGRVLSVELVEGDGGSMSGARIRVGNSTNISEILDKTFAAVNPTYEDQGVTSGLIRPATGLRFRVDAGAGAGKFRVKIRAIVGTV